MVWWVLGSGDDTAVASRTAGARVIELMRWCLRAGHDSNEALHAAYVSERPWWAARSMLRPGRAWSWIRRPRRRAFTRGQRETEEWMVMQRSSVPNGILAPDVFAGAASWFGSVVARSVAYPGDGGGGMTEVYRALMALDCLGRSSQLPPMFRASCARAIDLLQDPATGLFAEPAIAVSPSDPAFPIDAVRATHQAARALDVLGRRPTYPLAFTCAWVRRAPEWLASVDWAAAEGVERVALALSVLVHRAEVDGVAGAAAALHGMLDRLISLQDRPSGLWGEDTVPIELRIRAAHHVAAFLQYVHRPVQHTARLIDAVLCACPPEVGVATLGGDPAAESAAVALLATLPAPARAARDVRRTLLRSAEHLAAMRTRTGTLDADAQDAADVEHEAARAPERDDAVQRTWLRVVALGTIARRYSGALRAPAAWNPPRYPGPGWSPPGEAKVQRPRRVAV